MSIVMTNGSEKCKRVVDFLRKELQIPENVIRFKVVFAVDSLLTVEDMDYYPTEES